MKLFVVNKCPTRVKPATATPSSTGCEHFVKMTHGKAFVLFTNFKLMQEIGERMQPWFDKLGINAWCKARQRSMLREIQG